MARRSSRILEILRETIEQAEHNSELGPHDPGVIELKRLLARWLEEWHRAMQEGAHPDPSPDKESSANGKNMA